ncbi:MAG: glycosyltransferase [Sandaracinaceae bacterium]|nr:glycosyltransferase [Sandaracinaceae bacterium]
MPDAEAWCALPRRPTDDECGEAKNAGVRLLWPQHCPAPPGNDLFLLAGPMQLESTGPMQLESSGDALADLAVDAIVGHGRWTGPAAFQLARRHSIPLRVHAVHVDSRLIEPSKDGRGVPAGTRIDQYVALEHSLLIGADVLAFGVGPKLTRDYLRCTEREDADELLPGLSAQPLTLPGRPRSVLFVGRLEDGRLKGLDLALRELHEVAVAERVNLELRGAAGVIEDQSSVDSLIQTLRDQKPHERLVATVSPFTTESELLDASFRNASLVIMPSRDEGFGLVGLEAIARGRPVVVSRRSGLAEVIERVTSQDGDTEIRSAFLFDPSTAGSLADRVTAIFADPTRARECASRLRELLAPECDWDKTAAALVRRIREARTTQGTPGSAPSTSATRSVNEPAAESGRERAATRDLATWPRRIGDRWIDRPESKHLLDELGKDTRAPLLLVGSPGSGKSALLAKLTEDLRAQDWHVLAIKADQMPIQIRSDADLSTWVGLSGQSLTRELSDLVGRHGRVAVVLDQLDALASLVDLHTGRLRVLLRLIQTAAEVPGVRVVASMREFESNYDPQLRRLKSGDAGARPVEVRLGLLEPQAVAELWQKVVGVRLDDPPPAHLREPQTLSLAVQLRRPDASASAVATAFWKERVLSIAEPSALLTLVEGLDEQEVLWTAVSDSQRESLGPWLEAGVLLQTSESHPRVGFAHQTLHEEARAHQWLQAHDARALVDWVRQRLPTLSYRPKLRSILHRLRTEPPSKYHKVWSDLWDLGAMRINLRELLAVHLAQSESPGAWEAQRMRELLSTEGAWIRGAALSALAGREPWFQALEAWLEAQIETPGSGWLAGYLGTAWRFAAATLDRWLKRWVADPARRGDALWSLHERREWTDEGLELLRGLATPGVDEHFFSAIASRLEPSALVDLAVRYADVHWQGVASGDPYAAPHHFPWRAAASANPEAFVTGLAPAVCRLADQAAAPTRREGHRQFAHDPHAWRHLDPHFGDHPLRAFGDALAEVVARTAGGAPALEALSAVDNLTLQGMLLRAYQASVDETPHLLVGFLLANRRRLLLPEIGRALRALAPRIGDVDRERVVGAIEQVARYWVPEGSEMDSHKGALEENARYRTMLKRVIASDEPDDVEVRDFIQDMMHEPRGGIVRSPYDIATLNQMSEDDLVATLLCYDGQSDGFWDYDTDSSEPIGGNLQLCQELERWALQAPERAASLLQRLLRAQNAEGALSFRPAMTALLEGLAAAADAPAAETAALLERALSARLCEGNDSEAKQARWSVALQIVPTLLKRGVQLSASLPQTLVEWARLDAAVAKEPAEPLDDKSAFLPRGPGGRMRPWGSYPALAALARVMLRGDGGWAGLLERFEALTDRADARAWRALLGIPPGLRPDPPLRERWVRWLDGLFRRHPNVLAHPEGAFVLWSQIWVAPQEHMRHWVATLENSKWISGRRAAVELATMMACVSSQAEWAVPRLESAVAAIEDDATALGLAHGLASLMTHEDARTRAGPWAVEFARQASPERVGTMLRAMGWRSLRPGAHLFVLLAVLRQRDIAWPEDRAWDLAEILLEAVEVDPSQALQFAEWLLDDGGARLGGAYEALVLLALHVIRHPEDEALRGRAMDLFESVLAKGEWFARRAVRDIDASLVGSEG